MLYRAAVSFAMDCSARLLPDAVILPPGTALGDVDVKAVAAGH